MSRSVHAASILACDMRGLSHEKLAILAAEFAVALQRIHEADGSAKWWEYQEIASNALSLAPFDLVGVPS